MHPKVNNNTIYKTIGLLVFFLLLVRILSGATKPFIDFSFNSILSFAYLLPCIAYLSLTGRSLNFYLSILIIEFMLALSIIFYNLQPNLIGPQVNGGLRYLFIPITIMYVELQNRTFTDNWNKFVHTRFLYSALVVGLVACSGVLFGYQREIQGLYRIEFPFENPNTLGLYSGLTCWLCVIFLSITNKSQKIKIITTYAILLIFIFLTLKTGSLNGMFLTFSALLSYLCTHLKTKIIKLLVIATATLFSIFLIDTNLVLERIYQVFFTIDLDNIQSGGSSIIWRLKTWALYLSFLDIPTLLLGHGPGASRIWFMESAIGSELYNFGDIPGTHNDYLMILFDFGMIGTLIFIRYAYLFYKTAKNNNLLCLSHSFIAILFSMFFDNIIDSFIFVYFLYFSTFIYISKLKCNKPHSNQHID